MLYIFVIYFSIVIIIVNAINSNNISKQAHAWCSSILSKPEPSILFYNRIPKCGSTTMKTIYSKLSKMNQYEFIDLPVQIPELVTSTNLLRLNDFLMKSDHKKTDLISVYSKYSKSM